MIDPGVPVPADKIIPGRRSSRAAGQYDLPPLFQLEQEIPAGHIFHLARGENANSIVWHSSLDRPAAAPGRVVTDQLPDCLDVIFVYFGYPEFSFCFPCFYITCFAALSSVVFSN